jgi:hypothetical protein
MIVVVYRLVVLGGLEWDYSRSVRVDDEADLLTGKELLLFDEDAPGG